VDKVHFHENDLEAQDKQTGKSNIDVEHLIYEFLGLDIGVSKYYKSLKSQVWTAMSRYCSFSGTYMRHTGECSTALGNVITNLTLHIPLIENNQSQLICMLALGDDNLTVAKIKLDSKFMKKETADFYNIICKPKDFAEVGQFCKMLISVNESSLHLTPDVRQM
jgi:hypothetical protein